MNQTYYRKGYMIPLPKTTFSIKLGKRIFTILNLTLLAFNVYMFCQVCAYHAHALQTLSLIQEVKYQITKLTYRSLKNPCKPGTSMYINDTWYICK